MVIGAVDYELDPCRLESGPRRSQPRDPEGAFVDYSTETALHCHFGAGKDADGTTPLSLTASQLL